MFKRRLDYEGYLIINSAFKKIPTHKLDAITAIKAFDAEISTIADSAKSYEAASMRYEFWRTALEKIRKRESCEGHPLVEDLFKAKLTSTQVHRLLGNLNARAERLDRKIFSLADLDEYAHKSLVQILWCINSIVSDDRILKEDIEKEHSLDHLGKAQVVIRRLKGLAKAISVRNPQAEQFIPLGLLGKFGLNGPKIIESMKSGNTKDLLDIIHEIASHAHSHLTLINQKDVQSDLFLKLSKYCSLRYLSILEQHNFSIFHPKVIRTGSHRDGILPIKIYFKTIF